MRAAGVYVGDVKNLENGELELGWLSPKQLGEEED